MYDIFVIAVIVALIILAIDKFSSKKEESPLMRGEHIRGASIVTGSRSRDDMEITIGGIPISDESASKHIGFAGSTGSGKSTALREVLCTLACRVRERGDRVICVDNRGEFLSIFGSPSDTILNPFDGRSVTWNPFAEVRDEKSDFRMLSRSLYPQKQNSQPEWDDFAKTLFGNVLMKLFYMKPDPAEVLRLITLAEREEIEAFLDGTSSSISSSQENSKMFGGIRSTLAQALDAWYSLPVDGSFSLRRWVHEGEGFLWLPYRPAQRASLQYLISGWIDLLINEILALDEDRSRKIWLICDELTAIGQIPSLIDALTLGRKPGLSVLMCFQSIAQLNDVYGKERAQTVISNARTKLVLAQGSHLDAQFWSDEIGKREYKEDEFSESSNSGSSMGQGHSRSAGSSDSVSHRVKQDHLVLPSELVDLPDNSGFLRVAGAGGITPVSLQRIDLPRVMSPFVPIDDSPEPEPVSVGEKSENEEESGDSE